MKRRLPLLFIAIVLLVAWLAPWPRLRGVALIVALFAGLGFAIRWLTGTGSKLSSSGRDPANMSNPVSGDVGIPPGSHS